MAFITAYTTCIRVHSGGHEEFYCQGYNVVKSVEFQHVFKTKIYSRLSPTITLLPEELCLLGCYAVWLL
jgi:hypothetical protein